MARYRFVVEGAASPDLPLRILNLFAQQAIVLDAVEVVRDNDIRHIGLTSDVPEQRAFIILEKIRALIAVADAQLCDVDQ
jgi:hypothetical protein